MLSFRKGISRLSLTFPDGLVFLYFSYGALQFYYSRADLPATLLASWTLVVAAYLAARRVQLARLPLFLGVACFLQAGIAIMQSLHLLPGNHTLFQSTGTFWNPSQLGGFLACFLPPLANAVRSSRSPAHLVVLWLLLVVGLILSGSRAAWLATLAGIVYLFRLYPRGRRQVALVAACGLLLLVGLYFYKPLSALGRLHVWRVCVDMVAARPLFGNGIHSFPSTYMHHQAAYFEAHPASPFADTATVVTTPYNEFLHVLADQGIVGLLLFMALVTSFFLFPRDAANRPYLATLVAFLVFSCFSYPGENVAILFPLALCLGSLRGKPLLQWHFTPFLKMLCLLLPLCALGLNTRSLVNYRAMSTVLHQPVDSASLALFRDEPDVIDYFLREHRDFPPALRLSWQKRLAALAPTPSTFCSLGYLHEQQGDFARAEKLYSVASRMVPNQVRANYYLFKLYASTGRDSAALAMANRLVSQHVKIENSFTIAARAEAKRFLEKQTLK